MGRLPGRRNHDPLSASGSFFQVFFADARVPSGLNGCPFPSRIQREQIFESMMVAVTVTIQRRTSSKVEPRHGLADLERALIFWIQCPIFFGISLFPGNLLLS